MVGGPLRLAVGVEALLFILLAALNLYLMLQAPIRRRFREISFVHARAFQFSWLLVVGAAAAAIAAQVLAFYGTLAETAPGSVARAGIGLGSASSALLLAALGVVYGVFARYVDRIPPNRQTTDALVEATMARELLGDTQDLKAGLDLSRVGDVYTGRRRLGPYVSLTHYRAMMLGLIAYTGQRLGPISEALVYSVGRLAARTAMRDVLREVPDRQAALERMFDEIRANGIAVPEIVERTPTRIDVRLHENATAAGALPSGGPICHYQSGMLAGIFEALTDRPVASREVRCWGAGDRVCEFQLALDGGKTTPRT